MRCATGHKAVVVTLDMQGTQEWQPHFLLRLKLSRRGAGLRDGTSRLFLKSVCCPPFAVLPLFQQGQLTYCLVLLSLLFSVTSVCTLHSGVPDLHTLSVSIVNCDREKCSENLLLISLLQQNLTTHFLQYRRVTTLK